MTLSRTAIIAGNWKMNFGPKQAASFTTSILPTLHQTTQTNPHVLSIICPPAISLATVHQVMESMPTSGIELGAQNMYFEEKGAYTGEISPAMVKELCTTVILGHSERRGYFHESDELVNQKTVAALKHGLRPIVCVGENLEQYESGQTQPFIETQIQHSLANLDGAQSKQIVIAYEPIWAIGTGKAATAEAANQVIHFIRHTYAGMYGQTAADTIHVLYGGSVAAANITDFLSYPDIDGALIGGASLKQEFAEILQKAGQLYQNR